MTPYIRTRRSKDWTDPYADILAALGFLTYAFAPPAAAYYLYYLLTH